MSLHISLIPGTQVSHGKPINLSIIQLITHKNQRDFLSHDSLVASCNMDKMTRFSRECNQRHFICNCLKLSMMLWYGCDAEMLRLKVAGRQQQ